MYSIGVDIGGSHITSCMFEHTDKVLHSRSLVSRRINTKESKEVIIDGWVSAIAKTIELGQRPVKGVGIAMPGPFDYFEGISLITGVDKLEALNKVNIREELADRLKIEPKEIRFINDASAFSIAEATTGSASRFEKVVAITLGTGLGSSFVSEGKPVINAANVPGGGFLYNQSYKGRAADEIFSTRGILNQYKQISGLSIGDVRELSEKAATNDHALEVFNWFGGELGRFLAPYLRNFGAEVLVIGGNISKANHLFIQNLKQQLPDIEIHISELGEEAAIIGAALLLDEDFYKDLTPLLKLM